MEEEIITIRPAVAEDAGLIAEFNIELCRETQGRELDRTTVAEGVRRFVSERARGGYFVAVIDGEVVGQTAYNFEWSEGTTARVKVI